MQRSNRAESKSGEGPPGLQEWEAKLSRQRSPQVSPSKVLGNDVSPDGSDLSKNEEWFRLIVEQTGQLIYDYNLPSGKIHWDGAIQKITGFLAADFRQADIATWENHIHPDDRAIALRLLGQARQEGSAYHVEYRFQQANGSYIDVEDNGVFLLNDTGNAYRMLGTMSDVSQRKQAEAERKRAEAQLLEQEQFLRNIYDGVQCSIFVIDIATDGTFHYAGHNKASERFTGYRSEEVAGKTPEELFGETEGSAVCRALARCQAVGTPITEEEHLTFKGREVWSLTTFNPLRNHNGRIDRIVGTVIDITALKQVETALQRALTEAEYQSCLLRTVLDSTPDWIFAKDTNYRYILVNRSYAEGLGKPMTEILGRDDLELGYSSEAVFGDVTNGKPGFRAEDQRALAGEAIAIPYDPMPTASGEIRIFDTRILPLSDLDHHIFAVLGISRDLTERHQAEELLRRSQEQLEEKADQLEHTLQQLQQTQAQLIQTEKMSSLGQLVAGVAHEINNPVNFISGNISYAHRYMDNLLQLIKLYRQHYPTPVEDIQDEIKQIDLDFLVGDVPKLLNSMKVGSDRIQAIVASLRTFSRMDEAEMKTVDIHEGIDSTLMILQNRLKDQPSRPAIDIIKHYGEVPRVECYAGQLNQVFMNILSNAIDALEEYKPIALGSDWLPDTQSIIPSIAIHTDVTRDRQVQIRIKDNGLGIPLAVQQRLFDPFFTTKPVGKGTGMGLSISYQIIAEKHGGSLQCISNPGEGAEFIIQIPLLQA